jgi:hypothetical protein
MVGVNASLNVRIDATLAKKASSAGDLITQDAIIACNINRVLKFTPGTLTTTQADIMYSAVRTIAASGTDLLDIAGTLATPIGGILNEREVVAVYIEASASNTNDVVLGGASSNTFKGPFTTNASKLTLKPGEFLLLSSQSGWLVAADTGDILQVANSAGGSSVNYKIIIMGRSVPAGVSSGLLPINTVLPSISGIAGIGNTLTCSTGTWLNLPSSYAYQWKRDNVVIVGANASTYVFSILDIAATITCVVTATNGIGAASVVTLGFGDGSAIDISASLNGVGTISANITDIARIASILNGVGTIAGNATIVTGSINGQMDFSSSNQSGLIDLLEDI